MIFHIIIYSSNLFIIMISLHIKIIMKPRNRTTSIKKELFKITFAKLLLKRTNMIDDPYKMEEPDICKLYESNPPLYNIWIDVAEAMGEDTTNLWCAKYYSNTFSAAGSLPFTAKEKEEVRQIIRRCHL